MMPRPSCTRALAERADQLRLVRQRRPGGVHHRQHGSLALSYASESLPHGPAPRLPCSAFCFSPAACRIFVCVRYSPSGYRESLLPVFTAPLHAAYSLPFEHCYALLPPPLPQARITQTQQGMDSTGKTTGPTRSANAFVGIYYVVALITGGLFVLRSASTSAHSPRHVY